MTVEEFLARVEAKLDWLIERWEERDARWEERDADMKRFMDEWLQRHAKITDDLIRAIGQLTAQSVNNSEQIRANTEATWRMLDRFGEGPA